MYSPFAYVRPASVKEAVRHLGNDGVSLHAGGTDLLSCLRDHVFDVDTIVSLSAVKDLNRIRATSDGGVSIGAMTTITQVAGDPLIREQYPGLAQAAQEVASPQLRNQGTIGGNLCQKPRCWYYRGEFDCVRRGGEICFAVNGENQFHCIFGGSGCYIVHPSDTAPALIALQAGITIQGPKGKRSLPIEKLHVSPADDPTRETWLEPNEVITEITLPPARGVKSSYRKVRARRSWDFALAGCALALAFDGNRVSLAGVVLSGVAPVPWRSREAERAILGKELSPATIMAASKAATAGAKPLSQNGYKVDLLRGLVEEQLTAFKG